MEELNSTKKCQKCQTCGGTIVKVVGIVALAIVLGLAIAKDSIWSQNYDSVQVIGRGYASVVPDAAIINFGVLTIHENTAELAVKKTSEAIARVDAALEQAGISKENRQITGYVLNPRYKEASPDSDKTDEIKASEIIGYTSSQQITVFVPGIKDNTNRVNEIISVATSNGANQIGEVKMVATNAEEIKQKARLNAIVDANKKAEEMAKVSGLKFKGILGWYESLLADPVSRYKQQYDGYTSQTTILQPPVPADVIVLQPGQLEIAVELSVSYRIEKNN